MRRLPPFLRSFSVRVSMLVFIMLCITMITLRIISYTHSVSAAYNDIRLVLNAHLQELDDEMELHGLVYVQRLVQSMVDEPRDRHLYLALRSGNNLVGNLQAWPDAKPDAQGWAQALVKVTGAEPETRIYFRSLQYAHGVELLAGYDLLRVNLTRKTLTNVLLYNTVLSILLSFAIVMLVLWLLQRHLQRFNTICDQVMDGNLASRIPQTDSPDQINRLANNLNRMLDWINLLIDTARDTGNSIAHDMRTPISRLRLRLRALAEDNRLPPPLTTEVLTTIEQLDAVVDMFDNILNIAKAESSTTRELFTPFDLGELVTDVSDLYEPLLEEKQLQLVRVIPPTPVMLTGDRQLIGQSLANLLDNALKYGCSGGRIEVGLTISPITHNRHQLQAWVADSGAGIAPELLDKVTQRFFRVDRSRHSTGVGLGLSLVHAVMQLHHGTLELHDNQPGLKAILRFPDLG